MIIFSTGMLFLQAAHLLRSDGGAAAAHGGRPLRIWPLDRLTAVDRTAAQRAAQAAMPPGELPHHGPSIAAIVTMERPLIVVLLDSSRCTVHISLIVVLPDSSRCTV